MSNDPPFFARTNPWIFEAAWRRTFQAGALRSRGAMAAALLPDGAAPAVGGGSASYVFDRFSWGCSRQQSSVGCVGRCGCPNAAGFGLGQSLGAERSMC